jgi:hypothetical protein
MKIYNIDVVEDIDNSEPQSEKNGFHDDILRTLSDEEYLILNFIENLPEQRIDAEYKYILNLGKKFNSPLIDINQIIEGINESSDSLSIRKQFILFFICAESENELSKELLGVTGGWGSNLKNSTFEELQNKLFDNNNISNDAMVHAINLHSEI